jgi:3',5'-cyclic AMP phosphodiesterase CpdA
MTRRLVHVSDLHFGRSDASLVDPLVASIRHAAPHLVVLSGDLTQRATVAEFASARELMERMPAPCLAVPGNHDIPLWNAGLRFLAPRRRWERELGLPWISTWSDDEIIVVGIDSPRPWLSKGGIVLGEQLDHVRSEFERASPSACRVVVLHHPLAIPRRVHGHHPTARRASEAASALRDLGTDMVLAGHLHVSGYDHVVDTEREGLLHVLAPSALSTRLRGESNGFYVIDVEPTRITIALQSWDAAKRAYVAQEATRHPIGKGVAAA